MGKYLLMWNLNQNLVPADPKERATGWGMLLDMVKQDFQKGVAKDWGSFPGENRGYCILEGNHLDVMKMTQQYSPYVGFEVHPVASIDNVRELLTHMAS
jgi:hypothetical protein